MRVMFSMVENWLGRWRIGWFFIFYFRFWNLQLNCWCNISVLLLSTVMSVSLFGGLCVFVFCFYLICTLWRVSPRMVPFQANYIILHSRLNSGIWSSIWAYLFIHQFHFCCLLILIFCFWCGKTLFHIIGKWSFSHLFSCLVLKMSMHAIRKYWRRKKNEKQWR